MFPIRDDNPHFTTPYATYGLIALNGLVWALLQGFGTEPALSSSVCQLGLVPADLLQTAPAGTSFPLTPDSVCTLSGDGGSWHTVITSMFMHGGWLHLGGNMLYLWIFGDNVEDRFGHGKFILFYLLCGLAATFAQLAFSSGSNIPNLGASGAIAGVLGAYILLFPQGRVSVLQGQRVIQVPALVVIGLWIVLQFFSGIGSIANTAETGGVAYMAHIGGFIAGFVLTFVFRGSRGA